MFDDRVNQIDRACVLKVYFYTLKDTSYVNTIMYEKMHNVIECIEQEFKRAQQNLTRIVDVNTGKDLIKGY